MLKLVYSDSVLVLHLERRWFEMFAMGIKKCEYRDLQKYNSWFRNQDGTIRHFDYVVFALGYPGFVNSDRWLAYKVTSLYIGEGLSIWGAMPGVLYWCIEVGDPVDVQPWLSSRLLAVRRMR